MSFDKLRTNGKGMIPFMVNGKGMIPFMVSGKGMIRQVDDSVRGELVEPRAESIDSALLWRVRWQDEGWLYVDGVCDCASAAHRVRFGCAAQAAASCSRFRAPGVAGHRQPFATAGPVLARTGDRFCRSRAGCDRSPHFWRAVTGGDRCGSAALPGPGHLGGRRDRRWQCAGRRQGDRRPAASGQPGSGPPGRRRTRAPLSRAGGPFDRGTHHRRHRFRGDQERGAQPARRGGLQEILP
jgi:hypothetical protein